MRTGGGGVKKIGGGAFKFDSEHFTFDNAFLGGGYIFAKLAKCSKCFENSLRRRNNCCLPWT